MTTDTIRRCKQCGKPLPENARGDRQYCSKYCNNRHWKEDNRARVARNERRRYAKKKEKQRKTPEKKEKSRKTMMYRATCTAEERRTLKEMITEIDGLESYPTEEEKKELVRGPHSLYDVDMLLETRIYRDKEPLENG